MVNIFAPKIVKSTSNVDTIVAKGNYPHHFYKILCF